MNKDDTQKYFDNYLELFATAGWKQFIQDLTDASQDLDRVGGLKDERALFLRQGKLEGWQFILNYEAAIRAAEAEVPPE